MTARVSLVLASSSPARLGLLQAAGIDPIVRVSDVDEAAVEREYRVHHGLGQDDSAGLSVVLAQAKTRAVAEVLLGSEVNRPEANTAKPTIVVGADTILEFEGKSLGKPGDSETAIRRLAQMSGGQGVLHTGHCVIDLASGATLARVESTSVQFAELTESEIAAYVATGEPIQVAGSFTIDGIGSAFVTGIEGNFTNVVGLSIPLLRKMVRELGYQWPELWR